MKIEVSHERTPTAYCYECAKYENITKQDKPQIFCWVNSSALTALTLYQIKQIQLGPILEKRIAP